MDKTTSAVATRRKVLITFGGGLLATASGCTLFPRDAPSQEQTPSPREHTPPPYDCKRASRPSPTPSDELSVSPRPYPSKPESLSSDEEVKEYVIEYEKAYRQNEQIEIFDERLEEIRCDVRELYIHESTHDSALVSIDYLLYTPTRERENPPGNPVTSTYYIDDKGVLWASDWAKPGADTFPNPLNPDVDQTVDVLECFE